MSAATSTMGSWVRSTKKESRKLKGNLFYNYRKFMFFTIRIVDDRSKATELCVVSFQYATIPDSQESSSWLSASQAALSAQVERGEMPVEDARSWQCFSTDLGFSKTVFDSNESNADFRVLCVLNPGSLMGIRIGWSLAENLLQMPSLMVCHSLVPLVLSLRCWPSPPLKPFIISPATLANGSSITEHHWSNATLRRTAAKGCQGLIWINARQGTSSGRQAMILTTKLPHA